jgi:gamma-butyrobetaine dioxygenase
MDPLTPDFYRYAPAPLAAARLHGDSVIMGWADGLTLRAHPLWLAENTFGLGLEPQTREGMIDPSDLPDVRALAAVDVTADGHLHLTWTIGAGVQTTAHSGWLRHVAEGRHLPAAFLPEQQVWTAADFGEPPSTDGSRILDDDAAFHAWLTQMARFGIGRLRNTSTDPDFLRRLVTRIGPIRASNFGEIFDVKADIDPNSTANTGLNLGQHTDLPTRETPPGFQFLHCIKNTVPGGWSRMTDGFAVVRELQHNHPQDYEALTTLPWVFFNRSPHEDHRWVGPMIDHAADGYPLTLRAFYPVRGFPAMDDADVSRAYASLRTFSRVAHDPRFQISSPFEPGDLVGFDNRRLLHGRNAFEPGAGTRHLRGCYLDRDDLFSRLRVMARAAEWKESPR